jgi:hypothetical protein
MQFKSTTELVREAPSKVLSGLLDASNRNSVDAGLKLVEDSKLYGMDLRDYLRLKIDPRLEDATNRDRFAAPDGRTFLNGYEATLAFLNLPVKDDYDGGVTLQAASDTFATYPGTRALFPPVIDDLVKWRYHQTTYETTQGMVSQSRTIAGAEFLTTFVEDTAADYEGTSRAISEGGRIPIHAIKTSERSVKIYKFGLGYKTTYEFQRRARLDVLTPYAIRTQRQIERSKVSALTQLLLNGDGIYGAAPVVAMTSFNGGAVGSPAAGTLQTKNFAAWLVSRAKMGVPIDIVVGNWDMYLQWILTFSLPTSFNNVSEAERLAATGFKVDTTKILDFNVEFHLSSDVPAGQLLGYTLGDTAEELVEAGSQITQSEQSIQTQEITYVRTENAGYKLVYGDTRSVLDTTA